MKCWQCDGVCIVDEETVKPVGRGSDEEIIFDFNGSFDLQGCVVSTSSVMMKTDNGFYLSIKDKAGNEISTGASINDPEYIPELEKMYGKLVQVLDKIIKEQKE